MRRLLISLLVLFAFQTANAQPWMNKLKKTKNQTETNFYETQDAFHKYWEGKNVKNGYYYVNREKKKAYGWKQFLRWEWFWETRVDKKTGNFPKTNLFKEHKIYLKNSSSKATDMANWLSVGPESSEGGYAGVGRINCISFHPTNDNIFWIGAPAGGLWKTVDGGSSWEVLTDSNPVMGVSSIAIPNDFETSNTIYIATGDRDAGDNYSVGVLKSTDGGVTWNTTGLSYEVYQYIKITKLLIDPVNQDVLYASTNQGIYKTINAGVDWTFQVSGAFYDMEFKPGDEANTLYAVTKSLGSPAFYKTINAGTDWNKMYDFPTDASRVEIGVTKADSSIVYTLCSGNDSGLYGIYKSSDNGDNFTKIFDGTQTNNNLLGWEADGSGSGGQGWYDLAFEVSPKDTNELFVGGVNTWRSVDGAVSWACNNHWWGDQVPAVHADKHYMAYRDDSTLFECNDGGVYKTVNGGTDWTDLTNGMIISQMYKLSVSQTQENEVITGLQDNGTKLYHNSYWDDVKGGDGMECLIDYEDVNIQYGTYTNGQISRTMNHWGSPSTDISANIPGGNNGAWVTPYIIDPSDNKILYVGYSDVWKTTDRGDTWTQISNLSFGNKIRAMAIAPSNSQVIYITDYNSLWKTTDGGDAWSDVTNTLPVSNGDISSIAIDAYNPSVVWVTIGGYNNSGVFKSDNGGDAWTNISAGLPSVPVNTIVQNKLENSSCHLYAGTDIGVFVKDGDADWTLFNSGLANVVISELEIYYDNNNPTNSKLWAATYGRGLWTSNLLVFTQAAIVCRSIEGPIYVSADSSVNVDLIYTANKTFTSNTFNAYLSDADGDFTNEILIGTLESDVSDTIMATIPTNTLSGTNYKIRIKSTNPIETSIDNGSFEIVLDTIAPSSEITCSINGTTSISSFNISVTFSEDVYGFDINDINVTNGEVNDLIETNASNYRLTLVPDANGDVIVDVPENIVGDIVGNRNTSSTWSIVFTGNTGINDFNKAGIKIYPNPNQGRFTVSSKEEMKRIIITDISGRKILSKELHNNDVNIDLSQYAKGMYLISINVNSKILQAKILVE